MPQKRRRRSLEEEWEWEWEEDEEEDEFIHNDKTANEEVPGNRAVVAATMGAQGGREEVREILLKEILPLLQGFQASGTGLAIISQREGVICILADNGQTVLL